METLVSIAKLGLIGIAILMMLAVMALYFRVGLSIMYFTTNNIKYKKYLTDEEKEKITNMSDYIKGKTKLLLLSLVPLLTSILFIIIAITN